MVWKYGVNWYGVNKNRKRFERRREEGREDGRWWLGGGVQGRLTTFPKFVVFRLCGLISLGCQPPTSLPPTPPIPPAAHNIFPVSQPYCLFLVSKSPLPFFYHNFCLLYFIGSCCLCPFFQNAGVFLGYVGTYVCSMFPLSTSTENFRYRRNEERYIYS